MAPSPDVSLASLRGGLDDITPVTQLAKDMCLEANNVEFFWSTLGERRYGCEPFSLTSSGLTTYTQIVHLSEWFPDNNVVLTEKWALGATPGTSAAFARNDTTGTWSIPSIVDAINPASPNIYDVTTQAGPASLNPHGLLFISYPNSVSQDRLHVWDPNLGAPTIRRVGLPQPNPPTVANEGVGTISTTQRWYRIRLALLNGSSQELLLSEPSTTATITPSGTGAGIRVTRPTLPTNEQYNYWVVEGSMNGAEGDFYVLAHVLAATTTYDDTQSNPISFSDAGPLSDAIGSYIPPVNAKYVSVDGDRVVLGGHWTDVTQMSDVSWTPVSNDPGIGNDERIPISTTGGEPIVSTLSLDNYSGGGITGMSTAIAGSWYVFKWSRIYKLTRSQRVTQAYLPMTMSTVRGAIAGSIFDGADENGGPAIFFLDPLQGPSMISSAGLRTIVGIRKTWNRVNMSASKIIARGVYYPYKRQAHWWVANENNTSPNYKIISQVTELQNAGEAQVSRGWTTATGRITEIYSVGMWTESNVVDGITTVRKRPFIGLGTPDFIQRCDSETVTDDAGTAYHASITSAPMMLAGLRVLWGTMATGLLASANPGTSVRVSLIKDFGKETQYIDVPLDSSSLNEPFVIKQQDGLVLSESVAMSIQFSDPV
jgi:hypothetical protein